VRKVWQSGGLDLLEKSHIPSYADGDTESWKEWLKKSETFRYLNSCRLNSKNLVEKVAAREIINGLSRDAKKFSSAKELFESVCASWKLWIIGRHKDDIKELLPGKACFYTKEERLPIREHEAYCDILVGGSICIEPVMHKKISALEELRRVDL